MKINIFLGVFAAIVHNSYGSLTKCFGGECHIICPQLWNFVEQPKAIGSEYKGLATVFFG